MNDAPFSITILGGGTAGWITASILSKALTQKKFSIKLIESPDIKTVGVGEATIPPILNLLEFLGINQKDFVKALNATFKYGIHFEGWSSSGESYMHAFGLLGTKYQHYEFTDMWLAYRESLKLPPLNAFSATAISAYANRFNPPHTIPQDADNEDYYPLSGLFYAYHFDASLLTELLKSFSIKHGVTHILDTVQKVNLNKSNNIQSVQLAKRGNDESDLFIDCTGILGLLNKQTFNVPFISYTDYLPCDRALAVQTESTHSPTPYTKSIAMNAGWRWKIPLQSRNGNGYVFSSQFISENAAELELEHALGNEKCITEMKLLKFQTGYLQKPWFQNSVAVGLSSGFFEPLESTSIHLIQKQAFALKNILQDEQDIKQQVKDKFNKDVRQDAEEIRDFLLVHYLTNQRTHLKFWQYCREISVPDSLKQKLEQYHQTGYITLPKHTIFPYQSWLQVLTGQKVYPRQPPKLNLTKENAYAFFQSINQSIGQKVAQLPSHQAYLNQLLM